MGINGPMVSMFIDDIKIMGAKIFKVISQVKKELTAAFEIVDIRPINFYFGLKVSQNLEKMII